MKKRTRNTKNSKMRAKVLSPKKAALMFLQAAVAIRANLADGPRLMAEACKNAGLDPILDGIAKSVEAMEAGPEEDMPEDMDVTELEDEDFADEADEEDADIESEFDLEAALEGDEDEDEDDLGLEDDEDAGFEEDDEEEEVPAASADQVQIPASVAKVLNLRKIRY